MRKQHSTFPRERAWFCFVFLSSATAPGRSHPFPMLARIKLTTKINCWSSLDKLELHQTCTNRSCRRWTLQWLTMSWAMARTPLMRWQKTPHRQDVNILRRISQSAPARAHMLDTTPLNSSCPKLSFPRTCLSPGMVNFFFELHSRATHGCVW